MNSTRTWPALALTFAFLLAACGGGGDEAVPPPLLTTQPASLTVAEGAGASFTAAATGSGTLTYQWQRNGVDIAGATGISYAIPSAVISDSGAAYTVVVHSTGGNATSAAATLTVNGASTSQTIGTAGGTLRFISNATTVTLTVPPGALATNTVLSLQSLPPGTGIVKVGLQPAGVYFAQPVSVALQMPAGRVVKATTVASIAVAGKKAFVPTTVDVAAQTATTQLLFFGLVPGVTPTRFVGSPASAGPSRKTALASPPPPSSSTLTLEELAILQPQADVVNQAIGDLHASGRFEDAAALQLSIAALAQSGQVPEWQINAGRMLDGAATTVCTALAQAINVAQGTTITTYGDYQRVAKPVVYWEAASQALGAQGCSGTAWSDTLHAKLVEALSFVAGRVQPPPAPSGYSPVGNEIRSATGLAAEATVLRVSSVAADTQSLYVDPAVQPLRVAAFDTSLTSSDQAQYLTLLTALGPVQSLSDDAQHAATTFTATTKSSTATTLATKVFGKGARVGTAVKTGTLQARTDGTLEIAGNVAVLHCPGPAAERLQILFEGIEVANITSNGAVLLGNAPTLPALSMSALLSAAHIVPAMATQHLLVVRRLASPCAAAFQIVDDTLAVITLDFAPPPMTVEVRGALVDWADDSAGPQCYSWATDLSFPFTLDLNGCGVAESGTMRLALSDPKTLTFSLDVDVVGVAGRRNASQVMVDVTFSKAGTLNLALNPAWIVSWGSCAATTFKYSFGGWGSPPFVNPAGYPGAPLTPPVVHDACGHNGGVSDSGSIAVTAGQKMGFFFFAYNEGGGLSGRGTALTLHFEPVP